MRASAIQLDWPRKGIDDQWPRNDQPGLTSPNLLNVLTIEREGRARGGVRPGTRRLAFSLGGQADVEFLQVRECETGEYAVPAAYVPTFEIRPGETRYVYRHSGLARCFYADSADPVHLNVATASIVSVSLRERQYSCGYCGLTSPDPDPPTYRQVRSCANPLVVHPQLRIRSTENLTFVGGVYWFKWSVDALCYAVHAADALTEDTGTIITAAQRTTIDDCDDIDCADEKPNPPTYQQGYLCSTGALASIFLPTQTVVDDGTDGVLTILFDGHCYSFNAADDAATTVGFVPTTYVVKTDCEHADCDSSTDPPPCPIPPCTDPPPDPPPPPDPLTYGQLIWCDDDSATGLWVPTFNNTGGTWLIGGGVRCAYLSNDGHTTAPGPIASELTSVSGGCADAICQTTTYYQALSCETGAAVDAWLAEADVGELPFYVKQNDVLRCLQFTGESPTSTTPGTVITDYDAIDGCADAACGGYYQWIRCIDGAETGFYVPADQVPSLPYYVTGEIGGTEYCLQIPAGAATVDISSPNELTAVTETAGCDVSECPEYIEATPCPGNVAEAPFLGVDTALAGKTGLVYFRYAGECWSINVDTDPRVRADVTGAIVDTPPQFIDDCEACTPCPTRSEAMAAAPEALNVGVPSDVDLPTWCLCNGGDVPTTVPVVKQTVGSNDFYGAEWCDNSPATVSASLNYDEATCTWTLKIFCTATVPTDGGLLWEGVLIGEGPAGTYDRTAGESAQLEISVTEAA